MGIGQNPGCECGAGNGEPGVTRLAPSPTGALHLGNARTFLINWAMARQRRWRIVLRIEDLDGPRVKQGADRGAIEDLAWLGIDWDDGPSYQLDDLSPYRAAIERLGEMRRIYPCTCTRKDLRAAGSAPHGDEHELRYPGTCRPADAELPKVVAADGKDAALRVVVPDEAIRFEDGFCGQQVINVQQQVGDFVVATKAGLAAYQLAVVVDDARQGVTAIVRGDDLLRSTARQILLYRLLGLAPLPAYWHLPLVLGPDGRRLAKRHGDTRLASFREAGVAAERVIGLIACWCGAAETCRPMDAATFREQFDITRLPRQPITFTDDDRQWLEAAR